MQLLDLPLVLVQDIIEMLVLDPSYGGPTSSSTLELRLVNCFFEREITKYWGQHQLSSWWTIEAKHSNRPDDFIVRLLREHIGLNGRNGCNVANQTHAAVDLLAEQFTHRTGEPKPREEILHDACYTMVQSNYHLRVFTLGGCQKARSGECTVIEAAMQIATIRPYNEIYDRLLALAKKIGENCPHGDVEHAKWPMLHAVRFGRTDFLRDWFSAGFQLPSGTSNAVLTALRQAMTAGHWDVLDLVDNSAKSDEYLVNDLIDVAAEFQRWSSVKRMLGDHGETLHPERLKAVLCWACRHGNNEMILEVMKYGVRPRTESQPGIRKWPIREAVRGGHISTVQLLLENGAMGDHIESHAEFLGRNVAISGNFQLFELLRGYWFWKPSCEYNFLPLAAEYGHIEFAKYAIASKPKVRKIEDSTMGQLRPKEQLHYFSLFRAVVNGRYDIVRLLVQEVGLSVSEQLSFDDQDSDIDRHLYRCGGHGDSLTCCSAIVLAIDAGDVEMVRLLVDELGTEPLSEEEWTTFGYPGTGFWKKDRCHKREARKWRLETWASMLRLGKDYSAGYTDAPWSAVKTAYLAAREATI